MSGLVIVFVPREQQHSEYDWANILFDNTGVGKARCLINGNEFTIFSFNIYPEFQGNGYGKAFVEEAKRKHAKVIADRVRFKAIGFWEHAGFVRDGETSNWVFSRRLPVFSRFDREGPVSPNGRKPGIMQRRITQNHIDPY